MSLYNLLFFSHYHQYSVQNIKTYCNSNDSFLFSCVLISTLFWLKRFFHFDGDELTLFKDIDAIRSSRKGLKYFLSFHHQEGSNNIYNGEETKSTTNPNDNIDPQNSNSSEINQEKEFNTIYNAIFDNQNK